MSACSTVCVCGRSLAGIAGSNPGGSVDVLSFEIVLCCQIEVCAKKPITCLEESY